MTAQPKATQRLANKTFVVLGGTSGIGFAVASSLIEENATVIISSSSNAKVEASIKKLSDPSLQYNTDPKRISGHACNLKGEETEKNLEELFSKVGKIDGLIHTAGDALASKPLEEHDYNSIIEAGQVRHISAILAAKVGSKYIKPGGSIIFTTGSVSMKPIPNWAVVNSYATALTGLTRGLALDLSAKDIRVNCVSPGATDTELWDGLPKEGKAALLEQFSKSMLTKHVAQPHEVAQSYLYLLKDTNTSGETINTDGGHRFSA